MKANSRAFDGDPGRLAFFGTSSGGQLALMAAYRLQGVKAVVSWSGPTDLVSWPSNPVKTLLGCKKVWCPDHAHDASPIFFATVSSPPTFLAHSTGDKTVPFSQSVELDSALTQLGVDHSFLRVSGSSHGMALWSAAWPATYAWLVARL